MIETVPPVIFRSSFDETPFSVELIVSVPTPLSTMSSRLKIAASVFVVPSARNVPVTEREFSLSVVVTKTLSAFFT